VNTLPVPGQPVLKSDSPAIHPLAALLMVAVDNLWLLADWAAFAWIITIPLCFLAVCLPAYLIQKHFRGDTSGRAMAIGSLLGVLAAIPTSITGTGIGLVILGYAGLRWLMPGRK